MNRTFWIVSLSALLIFTSCKTTQKIAGDKQGPALLTFSKESVSQDEFERVYQKNNGGYEAAKNHSPEQYREYLNLYINFKRKVFEAEEMGLDTTAAFRQEFEGYRKQLAQPYLRAKEVEDQLVKEAYDRSQFTINAAHLMVSVAPEASPFDTLNAYNKALAYRDSIVTYGKDFSEMAMKYSQDPSAKDNKGELGYFSVFDMVYPFESAAYRTKPGEVSQPVRTQYGYHLVKVNEKLQNSGKKQAAHIIIRIGDRYSAKDSIMAVAKINEIYEKLQNGEEFPILAQQYSDDPSTARNGGDLGDGRLLPAMEEVKMKLNEGEYSKPFSTRFGWHILMVTKAKPEASFDDAKSELKARIQRDSRAQLSRDALLARIRKESAFTLNSASYEAFKKDLNANFPNGSWKPDSSKTGLYALPLFTMGQEKDNNRISRSLDDYIEYYMTFRPRNPRMTAAQAADAVLKDFSEKELLEYEEAQLPRKNPEFRNLVKEYRDGILLFTLMEQKVWKKAVEDTTGLRNYYEANQDSFRADKMVDLKEYRTDDESAIREVDKLLSQRMTDVQIDSLINLESALKLRITSQTHEKGKSELDPSLFEKPAGFRTPVREKDGFFRIFVIEKTYPPGIKPFDKAKSESITRYQDYLEREWLKELEKKYPVKVDEKVFNSLFE